VGFDARMRGASRVAGLAYLLGLTVVVVDQVTKSWVVGVLSGSDSASVGVWGPLKLTLVLNKGVSFGLLQGDGLWVRWVLALFQIAVVVSLATWVRRSARPLSAAAIGLIIGGALGNVVDRLRLGYVIDFVDIQRMYFPWVFNLADSAITVGVALLLAESLTPARKTEI
jgi:signal peptidase II